MVGMARKKRNRPNEERNETEI
jgi:hypothetical protein